MQHVKVVTELPDTSDDDMNKFKEDIWNLLHPAAPPRYETKTHPSAAIFTASNTLLYSTLIEERRAHQPAFSKESVHLRGRVGLASRSVSQSSTLLVNEEESNRAQLAERMNALLMASEARASTGLNRQVRHTGTATAISTATTQNNKVVVRSLIADSFAKLRSSHFHKLKSVHPNIATTDISTISTAHILSKGNYLIFVQKGEVLFGQVISMYSKGAGKSGKYGWEGSADKLGLVARICLQVFKATAPGILSSFTCPDLLVPTYLSIRPAQVLIAIRPNHGNKTTRPSFHSTYDEVILDTYAMDLLDKFKARKAAATTAVKALEAELKSKK
ncbi:hypothetical protein BOTBODRAFT_182132 [Botryobasidium botryosum FD-172 SS1]|uniref:Uncharacterized protein n=1 Tax=Botryobasidium botryosum (strain FD-172 SS1) TaxID=930990 RepID=A0A067LUI3_BOTB1|nr:hypothetical protein BOTBODRAFT_182132 [Botryobasidium botryosum FD-172 SS1]